MSVSINDIQHDDTHEKHHESSFCRCNCVEFYYAACHYTEYHYVNFCCAECHYTCHYAESHYAEHNSTQITPVTYVQNFFSRNLQTHIIVCNICSCSQSATVRAAHHRYIKQVLHKRYPALNDIMPSVIMPSVIMPSVIMPSVIMPSVIMPSVIMPSVIMPSVIMANVIMPSVPASISLY